MKGGNDARETLDAALAPGQQARVDPANGLVIAYELASLRVCGHTWTYWADASGSVLYDWPKRKATVRNFTANSHSNSKGVNQ